MLVLKVRIRNKRFKFRSSNKLKELIKEGKIQYVYRVSIKKMVNQLDMVNFSKI